MTNRSAIAELFLQELFAETYDASGALAVRSQRAEFNSADGALVMTLAAPGEDMIGRVILAVLTEASSGASLAFQAPGGTRTHEFVSEGDALLLLAITASVYAVLTTPELEALMANMPRSAYTQTYSTGDKTVAAPTGTAPATLTDNTGDSGTHDDTLAAVPLQRAGFAYFLNPDAASTSGGGNQLDIAAATGGETVANIVQPDYPRNVVLNFTDGDTGITDFQVDVVGFAPDGSAANQQFLFAGGLDQVGSVIFSRITSWTLTVIAGNGAGDTLDVGYGSKLGVPVPAGATNLVIESLTVGGAREDPSATDQTNNSFTATTALDAIVDVAVFFSYTDPIDAIIRQNQSDTAQKVMELVTQLTALIADDLDNRKSITAIIDDLQALELVL